MKVKTPKKPRAGINVRFLRDDDPRVKVLPCITVGPSLGVPTPGIAFVQGAKKRRSNSKLIAH